MQKLLVVEDQTDIRNLIRATLEYEDYELHEAEDGVSGLHKALALRPTLMLLDIMMPGELDGIQVCERIKRDSATRHIKIVLLTARGQKSDLQAGQAAGCDSYLVKPFSPLQLIETVEQLIAADKTAPFQ
jgi:two-component system, OmpR family, phosphate regulon response regulator PhoB